MDMHDWPYIKKSARRKKRLVKKDFDKQLIRLDKQLYSSPVLQAQQQSRCIGIINSGAG
jgi:hypothetical protein